MADLKLRYLLALQEWQAADQETERLILVIANREQKSWLTSNSIENFPCDDLSIIDHLWVKFSNGNFGFSVQQRIYDSLVASGKYNISNISQKRQFQLLDTAFFNAVGWTISQDNFIFNLQAPTGHLPTFYQIGNWHIFFSRVKACLEKY
ncbi:MAG: serine/threonine kinase [Nostocales cyanobacterium]|nr:MAG: serine/threonine kinase [Nostocales cyanobacterium]